jgi:hypothetical protein
MTRRHHDVGGNPDAAGAIVRNGKPDAPWQVAFTATLWALINREKPLMSLDEMRRGVEDMRPEEYDAMPYYDRQTLAVTSARVERGYLTWGEVEDRIAKLASLR